MRSRRALPALLAVAALALAGCGGSSNADAVNSDGSVDLSKVTLVVGDQKGGSEALLQAAGGLDDVPYTIEWKPFTSGPPMLDAINGGSVDVGSVGNTPPLFAIDQSKKIKVVSSYDQGGSGDAIVLPTGSTITDVAGLKGKKVAVAKGSSANYNLLAQLADVGLTFADIEPVYLQPTEALAAFKGGSVDAWAIWDPFTAQAELDAGGTVLSDGEGLVNGLGFEVAGDDALADTATRAAIEDYLARLASARVWAKDNKAAWSKVWSAETGLSQAVTDRSTERRGYQPIAIDAEVIAGEQTMWDAFTEQGQITRTGVDLADYFVTDFNDSVLAAAKEAGS